MAKTVALAPVGVATVRIIVSGSGMTTMQQDFAAAAGAGSISGVLAGSGRSIIAQGLDGSGVVSYQGSASNLRVQIDQVTDAGIITMLPAIVPTPPSGLTAATSSVSQINLAWTDNGTTETGFKIERKTGAGGTYSQIGTATVNANSYNDTGLSASTIYYYRVRATNGAGDSGYSNETSAITSADTEAPTTPIGFRATPVSPSQIDLSWNASTDNVGVSGYKIYRNLTELITTVTATTASITGLTASTQYCYSVIAVDAAGNGSSLAPQKCATTTAPPPLLSHRRPILKQLPFHPQQLISVGQPLLTL